MEGTENGSGIGNRSVFGGKDRHKSFVIKVYGNVNLAKKI
jgi:hypothetical protein